MIATSTEYPTEHSTELPAGVTTTELAEILFCSALQPSDAADPEAVRAAVSWSLRAHSGGVGDCAAELAESYGKDPHITCRRMRWARDLVGQVFPNVPAFG